MQRQQAQRQPRISEHDPIPIGVPVGVPVHRMNFNPIYQHHMMQPYPPPQLATSEVQVFNYKPLTPPPNLSHDSYTPIQTWNRVTPSRAPQSNVFINYISPSQEQYYPIQHRSVRSSQTANKTHIMANPNFNQRPMPQHGQPGNIPNNVRKVGQSAPIYYPQPSQGMYQPGNYNPNLQAQQYPNMNPQQQQQQHSILWFEWEFQRFQALRNQYEQLCEKLKVVDSQDDWNQLKQDHQELMEKFNQMHQELGNVVGQNQHLVSEKDHQYQQVWQQRYHQLLATFKALQDQMAEMQENQAQKSSQSLQRQHQELVQQFRQLQIQYSNVYNQLKQIKQKDSDNNQISDYRQKLQYALEEAQKYKSILDKLHDQNQQYNNYILQLEDQINMMKRQAGSRNKVQRNQYQQLLQVTQQKQQQLSKTKMQKQLISRQNKKLIDQIQLRKQQIHNLKQTINRFQSQKQLSNTTQQLNKTIKLKNDQILHYKNLLKNITDDFKITIHDQQQALIKQYQQKINNLNKQIKKLQTRINDGLQVKPIVNAKIQSYQKKINYYQLEISNLTQSLTNKNQQLMQMRGMVFQVERAKHMQANYQNISKQRDQLKQTIKQKLRQIQSLKQTMMNLENKIKQNQHKKYQYNSKNLVEEVQGLNNLLSKKDLEINRIKKALESKQNFLIQNKTQADKYRNTIVSLEKSFENQRQSLQTTIVKLQAKNNQQQKKIRYLQFQYGENMKNNLQIEINDLRVQNQSRQEIITRFQRDQAELRSLIANLQRRNRDAEDDVKNLNHKLRQYQKWRDQYTKQLQNNINNLETKQKQIRTMQMHEISLKGQFNSYKSQLNQLQLTLRNKNNIIKQLQDQTQSLNRQLSQSIRQYQQFKNQYKIVIEKYQDQIYQLSEKIKDNQNLNLSRSKSRIEFQTNSYTKLIGLLQQENQRLKIQLAKAFQVGYNQGNRPKSKGSQGLTYIQKRLYQFNKRLEEIILNDQKDPINTQMKDSNSFNGNYHAQFRNLKQKMIQLQQYCATLEIRLSNQQRIQQDPTKSLVFEQQERVYQEQVDFYKAKSQQFQSRVDNLLKVNKQLKDRVQSLLKSSGEISSVNYYKQQINLSQKTIQTLANKLKRAVEQNRNLKSQSSESYCKGLRQKQQKVNSLENKINQLNQKIRQLQVQKTTNNNQKINLLHQINKKQTNLQIFKTQQYQKLSQFQLINYDLNNKCKNYQQEFKKLNQKIIKLQQEKNKLNKNLNQANEIVNNQSKVSNPPSKVSSPQRSLRKNNSLLKDLELLL